MVRTWPKFNKHSHLNIGLQSQTSTTYWIVNALNIIQFISIHCFLWSNCLLTSTHCTRGYAVVRHIVSGHQVHIFFTKIHNCRTNCFFFCILWYWQFQFCKLKEWKKPSNLHVFCKPQEHPSIWCTCSLFPNHKISDVSPRIYQFHSFYLFVMTHTNSPA